MVQLIIIILTQATLVKKARFSKDKEKQNFFIWLR